MPEDSKPIEEVWKKINEISVEFMRINEKAADGLYTFSQTLLTTTGVVAGFGFTAFGQGPNHVLFFLGECCLGLVMVIGIWPKNSLDDFYFSNKPLEEARKISNSLRERYFAGERYVSDTEIKSWYPSDTSKGYGAFFEAWQRKLYLSFGLFCAGFVFMFLSFLIC